MKDREIKHHFDMMDEMEEKENLQSKHTLISYPKMKAFRLRFRGRVILTIPPFCLAALLLWTVCDLVPSAPVFLAGAKYFALSLALIEILFYLLSGDYHDDDD